MYCCAQGLANVWGPLDDVVMGGVSESGFAVVPGAGQDGQPAGIFSGLVSSSNNGGFASVSPACFLLVPSSSNHVDPSSDHIEPVHLSHVLVGDGATSGCYIAGCSLCATRLHHAVHLPAAGAA